MRTDGPINFDLAKRAFKGVPDEGPNYLFGTVAIDNAPVNDFSMLILKEGIAVAFLLRNEPLASAFTIGTDHQVSYLDLALRKVMSSSGMSAGEITYNDWRFPSANQLRIVAGPSSSDYSKVSRFNVNMPLSLEVYDRSFLIEADIAGGCSKYDGSVSVDGIDILGGYSVPPGTFAGERPPFGIPGSKVTDYYDVVSIGSITETQLRPGDFRTVQTGGCDRGGLASLANITNFVQIYVFNLAIVYREPTGSLEDRIITRGEAAVWSSPLVAPEFNSGTTSAPGSGSPPPNSQNPSAQTQLERLTIPANGSTIKSTVVLQNNVQYEVIIEGTYRCDVGEPGEFADAQFREDDNDRYSIKWDSVEFDGIKLAADAIDLSNHSYIYYIKGSGKAITFRIYDEPRTYGDNEGSLSSPISALTPAPAPDSDMFADLGNPDDEVSHNLKGWGIAQSPPQNPYLSTSGDRTKRYQTLRSSNSLDLFILEVGRPYWLTAEAEDGRCTDNFDIYVQGKGPIYQYVGKNTGTGKYQVVRHEVVLPAALIDQSTVTLTFQNTSTDDCGLAAVYNVALAMTSIEGETRDLDGEALKPTVKEIRLTLHDITLFLNELYEAEGLSSAEDSACAIQYVVQSGDSLSGIAGHFYQDMFRWPTIYGANSELIGDDPNLIFPGQDLCILGPLKVTDSKSAPQFGVAEPEVAIDTEIGYLNISPGFDIGELVLSIAILVTVRQSLLAHGTGVDSTCRSSRYLCN